MRFFLDNHAGQELEKISDSFFRITNHYIEIALPYSSSGDWFLVHYWMPRDQSSWWCLACVSPHMDPLGEPMDKDTTNAVLSTWQVFRTLLTGSITENYSQGALVMLDDPDISTRKWFVATILEGIGPDQPESVLSNPKSIERAQLVLEQAARMFEEFESKKLATIKNLAPAIWRGIKEGIWEGVKTFIDEYDWSGSSNSDTTTGSGELSFRKPALFRLFEEYRKRNK